MNRLAISTTEFGQMLHACRPPDGWGNSIAVAHSGGADSTCLLYLLHCWLSQRGPHDNPLCMLSLSVDHSLQPGSSAVAGLCRQFAKSLHIPSQILRIPWSLPPFPDRPETQGGPVETAARRARYRVLFDAMRNNHVSVLAMGHHADDQVETLIMRLARTRASGSPVGMRRCRRWGMGSSSQSLDWAGSSGMDHWVVRPLLDVPKDRILATCELHGLHYMDDPTNFQPMLTPRNFVRRCLSGLPIHQDLVDKSKRTPYDVDKVKQAVDELDAISIQNSGISTKVPLVSRLHTAASYVSQHRDRVEAEATQYLTTFKKPSPPSTLLLTPSNESIPTDDVQRAVVLRIIRFISPRPWGAPDSEASRRSSSLHLISSKLWSSNSESKQTFCAGSEVIWRPVFLRADGSMRMDHDGNTPRGRPGWLASRQPPIKRTRVLSPCVQDISALLAQNTESELLWDNRYLLTLRPRLLPTEILYPCRSEGSVMIVPHGRWLLPKIVWLHAKQNDLVLGGVGLDVRDRPTGCLSSAWVDFRWIRSLGAI